jgi:PDZ domain
VQDGWNDHNDDEETTSYPLAPLPPHERVWRHPSELGPTVADSHPPPTLGRGMMITAGVVGVAVAVGMIRLMSPGSPTVQAGSATSVFSTVATSQPIVTVIPTTSLVAVESEPPVPTTSPALSDTSPQTTIARAQPPTTATAAPISGPPASAVPATSMFAPLPTALASPGGHPAMMWMSGSYALTAADGTAPAALISVTLPTGEAHQGVVVSVMDGLAVVALSGGKPASIAQALSDLPTAGAQLLVESSAGAEWVLLSTTPDNFPTIRTTGVIAAGCAVRDSSGSLVGLTVPMEGTSSRIITIKRLGELVAEADRIGGWLGINGATVDGTGAIVRALIPGSPAETAGLFIDDRIISIDGLDVFSVEQLATLLRTYQPTRTATLGVVRGAETIGVVVTLGDRSMRPNPEVQLLSPQSSTSQPSE